MTPKRYRLISLSQQIACLKQQIPSLINTRNILASIKRNIDRKYHKAMKNGRNRQAVKHGKSLISFLGHLNKSNELIVECINKLKIARREYRVLRKAGN